MRVLEEYKEFLVALLIVLIVVAIVEFSFYYENKKNNNGILEEDFLEENVNTLNNCSYKHFKPNFEQGYDYTQDMEYENKIYHKVLSNYDEYKQYLDGRNLDIIYMDEDDFEENFVVITAIENISMLGLTVSDIWTNNDTLFIELNSFPDYINYDENESCISIKVPRSKERENIKVIDVRKTEQDFEIDNEEDLEIGNEWINLTTDELSEISLEDAIEIAKQYAKNLESSNSLVGKYLKNYTKVFEIKKMKVRPNNYWEIEEGIIESQLKTADFERIAYEVILVREDDEMEIERAFFYVDVYTGEVIAGREMSD